MKGISKYKMRRYLKKIQTYHDRYRQLTDFQLQKEFNELNNKGKEKNNDFKDLIAPVFAIVKEVFYRKLAISPYQEQIMSAIAMGNGCISEMKTGEGKTVAVVFLSILYSIKMQTHVVTVNDYLAERDFKRMLPVYRFLDISCSLNSIGGQKEKIYSAKVIYTAANSLIFDYLTEKIKERRMENYTGLISLDAAILDEIDFILLDNANSNFTVSLGSDRPFAKLSLYKLMNIALKDFIGGEINNRFMGSIDDDSLKEVDYVYSLSDRSIQITKGGFAKLESIFHIKDLTRHLTIYKSALQTIEAYAFYKKDRNYIVRDNRICLISEANGRIMPNSYKETGLQQAIEIKEGIDVNGVNLQEDSMTFQLFFNKYKTITGMSGTLQGAEAEFADIYGLQTYIVPLHNKSLRKDLTDIVFRTTEEKKQHFFSLVRSYHNNGQPILIISESEGEASHVNSELIKRNYRPQLLINETADCEEKIVKRAGFNGCITITTNMAGRGTDIIIDHEAIQKGGLVVIALNKFSSIRIDHQVKGRSGRQGSPGITLTLSSLEDSIWTKLWLTKYEKLSSLGSEVFYSEKMQKALRKELLRLQKLGDKNQYMHRKVSYMLDKHISLYKSFMFNFSKRIMNLRQFQQLADVYINRNLIRSLKDLKTEYVDEGGKLNLYKATLLEKLHNQIDSYGGELALALFKKIVDSTIDETIQDAIMQLNYMKSRAMANASDYIKTEIEFIADAKQIIDNYLTYVFIKSSELFISAKMQNDGGVIK